jgi:hypothetical protein
MILSRRSVLAGAALAGALDPPRRALAVRWARRRLLITECGIRVRQAGVGS